MNPILRKLGATHDLGWWLVGKPMVDFLFALTELLSLSITVLELWGRMCRPTARLFSQGGRRRLCTQILPVQGRPLWTTLGVRKLETLCCPWMKTASLCVPSFWHCRLNLNTTTRKLKPSSRCDGQRAGRILRSTYNACKASFAARCKNPWDVLLCYQRPFLIKQKISSNLII